jgi:hypothetical protein
MGGHVDVLEDVPGVGAALVLGIQVVGVVGGQIEVIFLFPRHE